MGAPAPLRRRSQRAALGRRVVPLALQPGCSQDLAANVECLWSLLRCAALRTAKHPGALVPKRYPFLIESLAVVQSATALLLIGGAVLVADVEAAAAWLDWICAGAQGHREGQVLIPSVTIANENHSSARKATACPQGPVRPPRLVYKVLRCRVNCPAWHRSRARHAAVAVAKARVSAPFCGHRYVTPCGTLGRRKLIDAAALDR